MPLEDGDRLPDQLAVAADVPFIQPQLGSDETDARPPLDDLLAGRMRLVDDLGEDRLCCLQLAALDQRRGQLDPHLSLCGIVLRIRLDARSSSLTAAPASPRPAARSPAARRRAAARAPSSALSSTSPSSAA